MTRDSLTPALTLGLKVALLEQAFYTMGQAGAVAADFTTDEAAAVTAIVAQETAHVTLLSALATVSTPAYDFTGGSGTGTGPFDPFTNKADFFALAQLLEDAGVRAYNGQFANLIGDPHLTTAFQIHSVEARHAAQIRLLRGVSPYPPTASSTDDFAADFTEAQKPYAIAVYGPTVAASDGYGNPTASSGEDNQIQTSSYVTIGVNAGDATAFDEPLSAANVTTILAFFNAD